MNVIYVFVCVWGGGEEGREEGGGEDAVQHGESIGCDSIFSV